MLAPLKFGWFRTLKNSARNSSMPASPRNPSFVSFTSEKSQSLSGGPVRLLRQAVPNWPIAVECNFGRGVTKKHGVAQ